MSRNIYNEFTNVKFNVHKKIKICFIDFMLCACINRVLDMIKSYDGNLMQVHYNYFQNLKTKKTNNKKTLFVNMLYMCVLKFTIAKCGVRSCFCVFVFYKKWLLLLLIENYYK